MIKERIKVIFAVAVLMMTVHVNGQSLSEIKRLLANKDFPAFQAYINRASKKYSRVNHNSRVRAIWELKRDLTPTYQECVIDADESFPDELEPNISTVQQYRIHVLATSKKIIYYDFSEKEVHGASWDDFTLNVLNSYRNEKLLNQLKIDFLKVYKANINQQELFKNSYTYGSACSIAAQKPVLREENDLIVESKNIQLLTKWLKSTNTEKQVYGIDGLYQLKKKGYKLSAEQSRIIEIIKNKKGNINICRGCIYSSDKISSIVNFILAGRTI